MDKISQLVTIYYQFEPWHEIIMPPEEAFDYHRKHCEKGDIYTYEEKGEVLGYYEREFNGNTCFLKNLFIKEGLRKGKVFKELYRHFFGTMPDNIEYIVGEKQKDSGKLHKVKIRS